MVLANRDQHILRLDAPVLCQVVHHLLIKSLFGLVGTPSTHNEVHHDAIFTTVLQLQAVSIKLVNNLLAIICREIHGRDHIGIYTVGYGLDGVRTFAFD